jgi:4-hydroxy-tetrahydrodipicolinate synthase
MSPNVIRRIVMENPSCAILKHEDWPGLEKISTLRKFESDGSLRHISILCGNGGLFLDFETERGADGAMSGYCFPDVLVETVRLAKLGDRDAAHDLFDLYLPLIRYEQQLNFDIAVREYVLMRRRILTCDAQRKLAVRYGATLIPSALVGDVLESRPEQERLEAWIMREVGLGVPLPGVYPPNEAARERFRVDQTSVVGRDHR